jgi:hypothetical protein
VYNPAFDVMPHPLIAGIITEKGIIQPVCEERIRAVLALQSLSIFDQFGKAPVLRSAEGIEAQMREEREGWGDAGS